MDGIRVITVHGELDLSTAPQLEEPLSAAIDAGDRTVVIDFSDFQFIDSTGIAVVVKAWRRLDREADADSGGRLALCSPIAAVQKVLDITSLEASIRIHASREAAVTAFQAQAT